MSIFVRLWGNKIPPTTLNSVKGKLCRNCTLPPPHPHSCLDPVHVLFISSIPVTQGFAGHAAHWLGLLSGVTGGDAGRCRKRAWMAPQFSVPVGEGGAAHVFAAPHSCRVSRCRAIMREAYVRGRFDHMRPLLIPHLLSCLLVRLLQTLPISTSPSHCH